MMTAKLVDAAFIAMLSSTTDMVFVKDAELRYRAASMPFVRMVGKEKVEEILGRTDIEILEDENLAKRYVSDDRKMIDGGENLIDYVEPLTDEDGQPRYGSTSKFLLRDEDGSFLGLLGITKDITRDYAVRQHYQQELKLLFKLPEDTYAVSYIDIDSWRIISQRRQCVGNGTIQACHTVEELCAAAMESIVEAESEAADFYRHFEPTVLHKIFEEGRNSLSFTYQRKLSDDSVKWVHNTVRFLVDVNSGHLCAMLVAKDVDLEKKEEKRLLEAARMDRMTKVLNRETTMDDIRKVLTEEAGCRHALFMMDVDNFKALNDTLGHLAGDEFLISFASELKENFRETDILGRIGGDEFFALLRNVKGVPEIAEKAQEVMTAIQVVCAKYSSEKLSCSIGISMYPENGKTIEELYAHADEALYQAKRKGKNRFVFSYIGNETVH